ncbi:methyltransferase domain-containing protein [Spirosoma sp. HMF4905]|uniref:Methyltransferase domain-containing protein n=1 Tax=Spirosoma arboris TaxID=2682092 RepID=A0A7K1S6R8_9BACT|nr:class I SAM-dependent methyltransferase [Spirosoma arboris]MVM29494.1 methyltransferase domain-containing protein [Spirosoma arboris]
MEDPKRIVQQGYDQLGSLYRTHYEETNPLRYSNWLTTLAQLLPAKAKVLELGCADGIPTARFLSQQFSYLGIDISPIQVEQARANVPEALFQVADMATLTFSRLSFDGVIALYSIIHLPLAEQPALFKTIYQWLAPNGYFLCITGADEWTGVDSDWIKPGTLMYWSYADAGTYRSWLIEAGFTIVESQFVAEGNSGHTFFLLQKKA